MANKEVNKSSLELLLDNASDMSVSVERHPIGEMVKDCLNRDVTRLRGLIGDAKDITDLDATVMIFTRECSKKVLSHGMNAYSQLLRYNIKEAIPFGQSLNAYENAMASLGFIKANPVAGDVTDELTR